MGGKKCVFYKILSRIKFDLPPRELKLSEFRLGKLNLTAIEWKRKFEREKKLYLNSDLTILYDTENYKNIKYFHKIMC